MKHFSFLCCLILLLVACSPTGRGLKCMDGKGVKQKKYALKKGKRALPVYYANSGGDRPSKESIQKPSEPTSLKEEPRKDESIEPSLPNSSLPQNSPKQEPIETAQSIEITDNDDYIENGQQIETSSTNEFPTNPTTPNNQNSPKNSTLIEQAKISIDNSPSPEPNTTNPILPPQPVSSPSDSSNLPEEDIQITPITSVSAMPKPDINPVVAKLNYDPKTQVVFNNLVYDLDEDFEYLEHVEFVPNFPILMYPNEVEKQLDSLVDLLKRFPEKTIFVYGNGGMDGGENKNENELKYQNVPDEFGFPINRVEIYYGSSPIVYDQLLYGLGNDDEYHLKRIKEEGFKLMDPTVGVRLGTLLRSRAKKIEDILEEKGINKKRIRALPGEFVPYSNHTVKIRVKAN